MRKMWLLLVAAGTGYLARCWQKHRKLKSEPIRCRHVPRICSSRRSPPCTPKRGRSTTSKGRGRRRRSTSVRAVGRRLFHDTKDGVTMSSHDYDSNSVEDKSTDDVLQGEEFTDHTPDDGWFSCQYNGTRVETLNSSKFLPRTSLDTNCWTTECMQDWWKELSLCNLRLPVPTNTTDTGDFAGSNIPSIFNHKKPHKNSAHGALQGRSITIEDQHDISLGKSQPKKTSFSNAHISYSKHFKAGIPIFPDKDPCLLCSDHDRGLGLAMMGQDYTGDQTLMCSKEENQSKQVFFPDLGGTTKHAIKNQRFLEKVSGIPDDNLVSGSRTPGLMRENFLVPDNALKEEVTTICSQYMAEKPNSMSDYNDGSYPYSVKKNNLTGLVSSEEMKNNLFIHPNAEDSTECSLKEQICLETGVHKKSDGGHRVHGHDLNLGKLLFWLLRGPHMPHQQGSLYCEKMDNIQHYAQKKCFTNKQHREQNISKFRLSSKRKEGSLGRRLFFQTPFKNVPVLGNHLNLLGERSISSCHIFRKYLLQALLDPVCCEEHDYDLLDDVCTNSSKIQVTDPCSLNLGGISAQRPLSSKERTDLPKSCKGQESRVMEVPEFMHKEDHGSFQKFGKQSLISGEDSVLGLGMGVGIMLMITKSRNDFESLAKLLKETESLIHELKKELASSNALPIRRSTKVGLHDEEMVSDSKLCVKLYPSDKQSKLAGVSYIGDIEKIPLKLFSAGNELSSTVTEENMHRENHMADLEAELEAELERMEVNIYSTDSTKQQGKQTKFKELDLESTISMENEDQINCDAPVESGSEDHDIYVENNDTHFGIHDTVRGQVYDDLCESTYAVSARELERRLWQVLEQQQQERISELENTLDMTHKKLFAQENELQWWKDRVWWLTEASSGHHSGTQHPVISLGTDEIFDSKEA